MFKGTKRKQNTSALRPATVALAALALVSAPQIATAENSLMAAQTESTVVDSSGGARINLSGKLRMLSQRIVASACYAQAGIATDDTRAMLEGALAEFARITDALEHGNAEMGIHSAEEKRRTVATIERLNLLFAPYKALAEQVLEGNGTADTVAELATQSAPLLEMAQLLVTRISTEYANPGELLMMDAMAIDVAGRERMLAQRVSKNVCLLSTGLGTDTTVAELQSAAQVFENSLMALREGMPEAGIRQPPTTEIEIGLDRVIADWQLIQPKIAGALEGTAATEEQLAIVFATANRLTGGMNAVVGLYDQASELGS